MEDPLLPVSTPVVPGDAAADVAETPFDLSSAPPLTANTIFVRLFTLLTLGLLSLWASSEDSRDFDLDVVNAAAGSPAGRRFDLMFVSNGRASRAVLDASQTMQRALYHSAEAKKPVRRVTLRLADGNLSASVIVQRGGKDEYVVHVSSGVMLAADASGAMRTAVFWGMARVWLWDGQGGAPETLLNGMADYLATSASLVSSGPSTTDGGGDSCCRPPASQDRLVALQFIRRCEQKNRGFVGRLNRGMRWRWRSEMVEEAGGVGSRGGQVICRRTQSTSGVETGLSVPAAAPLSGPAAERGERESTRRRDSLYISPRQNLF